MTASALISKYKKLRDLPAWKLLAASTAPEILGILQTLLFDSERRVKESVLIERMLRIYNEMETETFTREMVLAKLTSWRNDKYVIRQFVEGDEEPCYELTPGAFDAISFVSSQSQERIAPTSSRLGLLLYAIRKLEDDTNSDVSKRILRLEKEQRDLNKKIDDARQGKFSIASELEIRSQIQDILTLLESIDGDFLRVRDRLISISNDLQADILSRDDYLQAVLTELFEKIDRLDTSDEGKTFNSFFQFLSQEITSGEIDSLLAEMEQRAFWSKLDRKETDLLSDVITHLRLRSQDTMSVQNRLSSGLRQLVRNRNLQENRRLKQLLQKARHLSVQAVKDGAVGVKTVLLSLDKTFVRFNSPAQGVLYDPSLKRTLEEVPIFIPDNIDQSELGRQLFASEIDFNYLRETIEQSIKIQSPITLGQIIRKFPLRQGLGSVVGYIHLAKSRADKVDFESESVTWKNRLGEDTEARIPKFVFSEVNLDSEGRLI